MLVKLEKYPQPDTRTLTLKTPLEQNPAKRRLKAMAVGTVLPCLGLNGHRGLLAVLCIGLNYRSSVGGACQPPLPSKPNHSAICPQTQPNGSPYSGCREVRLSSVPILGGVPDLHSKRN